MRTTYLEFEGVVRSLWRRKAAAVRVELQNLTTLLMDLPDSLDSIEMVDSGVNTDLIQDCDAGSGEYSAKTQL